MESNKLLKKAKKDYPIGTKFIAPDNNTIFTVSLNETIDDSYYLSMGKDQCLVTINDTKSGQFLYYKGKWAEIVFIPKGNENYKYIIQILKKHGIK